VLTGSIALKQTQHSSSLVEDQWVEVKEVADVDAHFLVQAQDFVLGGIALVPLGDLVPALFLR
jgi:hypothetical protein